MNTHPHGEQISAYLDGMLDVARMRDVAAHLQVCPACRAAYEELQRTKELLQAMAAPAPPAPEFWANTYRRLRTEGEEAPARRSSWEALRAALHGSQRRWAAGVAAVAVVGAALAAPLISQWNPGVGVPLGSSAPAPADSVDVSSLVRAHTESAAVQPLADPDRQAMISADVDDSPLLDPNDVEAAVHADSTP